jgi:hypothetical protein
MNPYWKFGMRALMVALAMAGLRFAGPASDDITAAALSKDACALLKPADIQALDPNVKIGSGVLTENGPLGATCQYHWGPRTSEWGETALNVTLVNASLELTFHGGNALAQKDKLIALVKAAAAAL